MFTLQLTALITLLALTIFAIILLVAFTSMLHAVQELLVKQLLVILSYVWHSCLLTLHSSNVFILLLFVMTTTLVLQTLVTMSWYLLIEEVSNACRDADLLQSFVTTAVYAPLILAILSVDALSIQFLAKTTTLAPMILASQALDANTLKFLATSATTLTAHLETSATSSLAIQPLETAQPKNTLVTMEILALLILALTKMELLYAPMLLSSATKLTLASKFDSSFN